jgi:hypothetical protein
MFLYPTNKPARQLIIDATGKLFFNVDENTSTLIAAVNFKNTQTESTCRQGSRIELLIYVTK